MSDVPSQSSLSEVIVALDLGERVLNLTWADGYRAAYHYIWLRDNCPCSGCLHANGQRLVETSSIPLDIRPSAGSASDGSTVNIVWGNDGHTSQIPGNWLRSNSYSEPTREPRQPQRGLWNSDMMLTLPECSFQEVSTSDTGLKTWLGMIAEYGVALLHGVPCVSGTLTEVAELFGYVRETNFGRFFEVRTVVDPNNVAYTNLPLTAHSDNPYRDPVPSLQLLHCLSSSDIGGDSTVVDGFCVANALREREPEKFKLLTTIPVRFRFFDKDTDLDAEVTLINLSPRGEVDAVRINAPTALPFDIDFDLMEPFYEAYRTFALMLESSEFQVCFRLDPGDLYIVDNTRVLHGRTAFSAAGSRHLQGCYADRDALLSRLSILRRKTAGSAS